MKTIKPLTDADCRNLKPDPTSKTPPRARDGFGLYLEVLPNGRRVWRFDYKRNNGTKTRATFGDYPAVTLAKARLMRDEARGQLAEGLDVNEHRARQAAAAIGAAQAGTFEVIAREWYAAEVANLSESYQASVARLLDRDVLPFIGKRPLADITPRELLDVFRRVKDRGAEETARRARVLAGQVFRYAIRTDRAENDPTLALRGEKRQTAKKHFAALTEPDDVARLMVAIHAYRGTPEVRGLVLLSALLFQRPGELRRMVWNEINLDRAEWRYTVTKTKTPHIVPLSVQAVAALRELQPLTDHQSVYRPDMPRYVFPSPKTRMRPASENAVRQALRNMGFTNDEMTAHGFRAMARSLLSEQGWKTDAIERQLAHKAAGPLGAAYDRASYLEERRLMMQAWADYLDSLRRGESKVTPIRRTA